MLLFLLNVTNVKKSEHHAAVCPSSKNFASKSSKSSFNYQLNPGVMNPVLSFTVSRGKSKSNFVFLLDTGVSLTQFVKRPLKNMLTSVAVLLWLDLCVLMAKLWVEGLKDTIILPNLLYLEDKKLMLTFLLLKICLFS